MPPRPRRFAASRAYVENLLAAFAYHELSFDRETAEYFHPGRSARALMDGAVVAQFGQIAEDVKAERKLRQDVFLAELDVEQLHARGLRTSKVRAARKVSGGGAGFFVRVLGRY